MRLAKVFVLDCWVSPVKDTDLFVNTNLEYATGIGDT